MKSKLAFSPIDRTGTLGQRVPFHWSWFLDHHSPGRGGGWKCWVINIGHLGNVCHLPSPPAWLVFKINSDWLAQSPSPRPSIWNPQELPDIKWLDAKTSRWGKKLINDRDILYIQFQIWLHGVWKHLGDELEFHFCCSSLAQRKHSLCVSRDKWESWKLQKVDWERIRF